LEALNKVLKYSYLPRRKTMNLSRAKQINHKYLHLPSGIKRGRAKSDWRYRNRVGQRAEALRKG